MADQFKLPANFLSVAAPFGGKTTLNKYLLYEFCRKKRFNYGLVFTETPEDYNDIIQPEYICQFYSEERLNALMQLQVANADPAKPDKDPAKYPPAFVVFDDCLGFNFNSMPFTAFYANCRHKNISVFVSSQNLKSLKNTAIYKCSSYTFIFYQADQNNIKALFEYYSGGIWASYKALQQTIVQVCQDRTVLVVDNRETDPKKKLFKFRVPDKHRLTPIKF